MTIDLMEALLTVMLSPITNSLRMMTDSILTVMTCLMTSVQTYFYFALVEKKMWEQL